MKECSEDTSLRIYMFFKESPFNFISGFYDTETVLLSHTHILYFNSIDLLCVNIYAVLFCYIVQRCRHLLPSSFLGGGGGARK